MSALIRGVRRLWLKKRSEEDREAAAVAAAAAFESGVPDERQQLLPNGNSNGTNNSNTAHKKYFAINHASDKNFAKTRTDPQKAGWLDYFKGFGVLFPYLWPSDSRIQQATVVLCLILLIGQRVINVLVPTQLGRLVDAMGSGNDPAKQAVLYVVFRALQGQQGVLGAMRSFLWIKISQSLFRRLSCAAFEHVLVLSMDFHLSKRIGEVTSALSKGSAMNTFLDGFLFSLFPMVFDIFVASVYFIFYYDVWYALTVILIMSSYIFLTIWMARYRGRARRDMATKAREMDAVKTEALLAYETVHHDSAVEAESTNFANHVTAYQSAEYLVLKSLNVLNVSQNMTFTAGTAIIVALSVYKISKKEQTVAEFVSLITYFAQLQAPLNFFGTFYTMVQNNLIDAERMLDLFRESPGVVEKEDAEELINPKGEVRFENVNFSYNDASTALRGVSFTVRPDTMTALVGESGSGKSTCLKLLFRFYDVTGGSISVDGHDLRDVTLKSLRKQIGVVPQDTHLFNNTLMYNLIHAKPNATKDDVFSACKAANIHERILSFPDGYETKVGERGMKLSGGERQRIAIARALLKNSQILLLDEATASLDSHTEKQIQDALENATSGRTTITIAHRLSTITKADQILVLHQGEIVERGTHHELLGQDGRYAAMWRKQTSAEQKKVEVKENLTDDK